MKFPSYSISLTVVLLAIFVGCSDSENDGNSWQRPELVNSPPEGLDKNENNFFAADVSLSEDNEKNIFAVWQQEQSDSTYGFSISQFIPRAGWKKPEALTTPSDLGENAEVFKDTSGNIIAWSEIDNAENPATATKFSVYRPGKGWTELSPPFEPSGITIIPSIRQDNFGNVFAIWSDFMTARNNLWFMHYTKQSGWSSPISIYQDSGVNSPIAFDVSPNGHAIAVWDSSTDPNMADLNTLRFDPDAGWESHPEVINVPTYLAAIPTVAINDAGQAILVWNQNDLPALSNRLFASQSTAHTGWTPPELISSNDRSTVLSAKISMNSRGNTIAAWFEWDQENRVGYLVSSYHDSSYGWTGPASLASTQSSDSQLGKFSVALGKTNDAFVLWTYALPPPPEAMAATQIFGSHFSSLKKWGSPVLLGSNVRTDYDPAVVVFDNSAALAAWSAYEGGKYAILSRRYGILPTVH